MKTTKLFILAVGALLTASLTTSCDEDLTSTPLSIDDKDSTVLRIYPKADLDLSFEGDEAVPAGTMVTLTLSYDQFNSVGSGGASNSSIILTDTINSDGYIEFTVPVDDDGVNVYVTVSSFVYDQVQGDKSTVTKWYSRDRQLYSLILATSQSYKELTGFTITTLNDTTPVKTATLIGNVTAELNLTTAGNEPAPEGTVVTVTLTSSPSIARSLAVQEFEYEGETSLDSNGQFSIEVPFTADGSQEFEVTIAPFTANQIQAAGSTPSSIAAEFGSISTTYTVTNGQTQTKDIVYDDPTLATDNETEFVTISGQIFAETDFEDDDETLNNQTFVFYTRETEDNDVVWSQEVTTNDQGTFSVDVPASIDVYIACTIEVNRTIATDDTKLYRLYIEQGTNLQSVGSFDFPQGGIELEIDDTFEWVEIVNP